MVGVDRYGVDVVGMSIGVDFSRNGGDDVILWEHAGELEMRSKTWRWEGTLAIKVI